MWSSRTIVALLALVSVPLASVLGACGLRPLYQDASETDTVPQMAAIAVEEADTRLDRDLRNKLLDILTPAGPPGEPLYLLSFNTKESVSAVLITKQETITRYNMRVNASYALKNSDTGEVLTKGNIVSLASFNVLRAEFANVIAEQDARRRAAQDLAEQIRTRLALFFRQEAQAQ
jgi:LPS-assembly lipoprotein